MNIATRHALDFGERVGATFFQAFLAIVLVQGISDVTALEAAAIAGGLAAAKFAQIQLAKYLDSPQK